MKIILASGSPRRKKLLQQINLDFTVQPSNASEDYNPQDSPGDIVRDLAKRKALEVARKQDQPTLTIGADTIVVFNGQILEKPADAEEAIAMLSKLSGTSHEVLTGVALVKNDNRGKKSDQLTFMEKTVVTFGELDETEISEYVDSGSPFDKAGGYGIQDDWGSLFVKKIDGDYYNVVGFPIHAFYQHLKIFAPELITGSIRNHV